MELFDFPYHTPTTQYPESGDRLQLGGGYMFTAAPTAPDQRIITLNFEAGAMRNYWNPGSVGPPEVPAGPDITTNATRNFYALEKFYQDHRMHLSFEYEHPQYGLLVVKFNKPLATPKAIPGRFGEVEGFTVELIEQP